MRLVVQGLTYISVSSVVAIVTDLLLRYISVGHKLVLLMEYYWI